MKREECSWCGAECPADPPRDRFKVPYCTKAHRDASSRALRQLRDADGKDSR